MRRTVIKKRNFVNAATEGYVPLVKDGKWEMRNSKGDLVISSGAFEESFQFMMENVGLKRMENGES